MSYSISGGEVLSAKLLAATAGMASPATRYLVVNDAPASIGSRFLGFGFQSSRPRVLPTPPAVQPAKDAVLRRMRDVLRSMPDEPTEAGAAEDLASDIAGLAALRGRANASLLGDED
jgi:hypothetical protein